MELEQIRKLVKETMQNWELDDLYLCFVHAVYKDSEVGKFLVHIAPKGNRFYVITEVELTKNLRYQTERDFDTEEELVQYLEKLDKLDIKDLDNAKEEMNKDLEKYFENTFLGNKEEN
jgi:hypothetical protein